MIHKHVPSLLMSVNDITLPFTVDSAVSLYIRVKHDRHCVTFSNQKKRENRYY